MRYQLIQKCFATLYYYKIEKFDSFWRTEQKEQAMFRNNEEDIVRKRPLGVTILAAFMGIEGAFSLIFAALSIISLSNGGQNSVLSTFLYVIVGLISIILARGLWQQEIWAFWGTIGIEALSILYTALAFFLHQPGMTLDLALANIVIPAFILLYLGISSNARDAFRP